MSSLHLHLVLPQLVITTSLHGNQDLLAITNNTKFHIRINDRSNCPLFSSSSISPARTLYRIVSDWDTTVLDISIIMESSSLLSPPRQPITSRMHTTLYRHLSLVSDSCWWYFVIFSLFFPSLLNAMSTIHIFLLLLSSNMRSGLLAALVFLNLNSKSHLFHPIFLENCAFLPVCLVPHSVFWE